jgi:hypothetical protein
LSKSKKKNELYKNKKEGLSDFKIFFIDNFLFRYFNRCSFFKRILLDGRYVVFLQYNNEYWSNNNFEFYDDSFYVKDREE